MIFRTPQSLSRLHRPFRQYTRRMTALMLAAEGGHVDVVSALLAAGDDAAAVDEVRRNQHSTAYYSLLSHFLVNKHGTQLWARAWAKGHNDVVTSLMTATKTHGPVASLIRAAFFGRSEVVDELLASGAPWLLSQSHVCLRRTR